MERWCSIPYPLDPCKGYPPAKPDSIGAKNFRKGLVAPPTQAEFVEAAQKFLNHGRIMQTSEEKHELPEDKVVDSDQQGKPVLSGQIKSTPRITQTGEEKHELPQDKVVDSDQKGKQVLAGQKQSTSQITQTSNEGLPSEPVDVDRVEDSGQIMRQKAGSHPCVCPPEQVSSQGSLRITQSSKPIVIPDEEHEDPQFSVTSETTELITIEDDDQYDIDLERQRQKLNALKRKMIPSRKSPRVKLPKLDLQRGVKSALPQKERSVVESLAKNIISNLPVQSKPVPSKPVQAKPVQSKPVPSKPVQSKPLPGRGSLDVPSSSSTSSQSSVKQKSILQMYANAVLWIPQQSKKKPVLVSQSAQQTQKSQQSQRSQKSQQYKQTQLPGSQQITQMQSQPVMPRRIAQANPEKGPILSCTYCHYTTLRKESLNDHLKMHTGEKIQCPKCVKTYYSKKSFRNHFNIVHLKKDRCFCTEAGCTWSGKDYGNRRVHLYEVHGIGEPPICEHLDCKERGHFSNFRTLQRHRETYHKGKDMLCPHCDKKYKNLENLRNHIDVHHKGKSAYQCEICGQFYTSEKTLGAHKKEHD